MAIAPQDLVGAGAADLSGRRNMILLTQLRWLAVAGQLAAILFVWRWLAVDLPIVPMILIVVALAALNLGTLLALRGREIVTNRQLFAALLVDWIALTAQLFLSGGATNPFASIGLLQVVLGAVLLEAWSSWTLLALHNIAFGALVIVHRPLDLPPNYASLLSPAHVLASWINFLLVSILLVLFVTRISRNLRARDTRLAEMRQREAEEDHIVRMGLLASGAAHELGTPLASLSVILGDWRTHAAIAGDADLREEVEDMRTAVSRCKQIVSGILLASGEARGEAVERISVRRFVARLADDWSALHPSVLHVDQQVPEEVVIAADRALGQILTNLLDNALEAGAGGIALSVRIEGSLLRFDVADDGPGFSEEMLKRIGEPYASSRNRRGAGLGLFLAVNMVRKLGGDLRAENRAGGGASVALILPLKALALNAAYA